MYNKLTLVGSVGTLYFVYKELTGGVEFANNSLFSRYFIVMVSVFIMINCLDPLLSDLNITHKKMYKQKERPKSTLILKLIKSI